MAGKGIILLAAARGGLGQLLLAAAVGAAAGAVLAIVLGEVMPKAPNQGGRAGRLLTALPQLGAGLQDLPRRADSFWRQARRRWEEALAAGKEAARQAEADMRRRYQESIQPPRRRRRR